MEPYSPREKQALSALIEMRKARILQHIDQKMINAEEAGEPSERNGYKTPLEIQMQKRDRMKRQGEKTAQNNRLAGADGDLGSILAALKSMVEGGTNGAR